MDGPTERMPGIGNLLPCVTDTLWFLVALVHELMHHVCRMSFQRAKGEEELLVKERREGVMRTRGDCLTYFGVQAESPDKGLSVVLVVTDTCILWIMVMMVLLQI